MPHQAAVAYDPKRVNLVELRDAIFNLPDLEAYTSDHAEGRFFFAFTTEEAKTKAMSSPLSLSTGPLPIRHLKFSTGIPLKIRAEKLPLQPRAVREQEITTIFQGFGKILEFTELQARTATQMTRSDKIEFVLELDANVDRDLLLPRSSVIQGRNALFSWPGSPFCYHCGGDHTRQACLDVGTTDIRHARPLRSLLMARAFGPKPTSLPVNASTLDLFNLGNADSSSSSSKSQPKPTSSPAKLPSDSQAKGSALKRPGLSTPTDKWILAGGSQQTKSSVAKSTTTEMPKNNKGKGVAKAKGHPRSDAEESLNPPHPIKKPKAQTTSTNSASSSSSSPPDTARTSTLQTEKADGFATGSQETETTSTEATQSKDVTKNLPAKPAGEEQSNTKPKQGPVFDGAELR
ncbi:hypothetical protein DFQ27_001553, partial [Actinomortierella ambigua]